MRLETSASLAPVWRMRWRPSLGRWTATGAWSMTRWAVIGGHEVTWPDAHLWLVHDQINTHLGILGMHFDDFETGLMGQFDRSFRLVVHINHRQTSLTCLLQPQFRWRVWSVRAAAHPLVAEGECVRAEGGAGGRRRGGQEPQHRGHRQRKLSHAGK